MGAQQERKGRQVTWWYASMIRRLSLGESWQVSGRGPGGLLSLYSEPLKIFFQSSLTELAPSLSNPNRLPNKMFKHNS